jgi:phage shock protein A
MKDWSVAIYNQAQLCKYWAIVTKGIHNKIDTRQRSMEILQQLPLEMQTDIQRVTREHDQLTTQIECHRQL